MAEPSGGRPRRFSVGAVLTGGASRRMGTDKAFVEVDGAPLVHTVAGALRAGGARRVVAVGGDRARLLELGLGMVPDRWPGEGPMAGVVSLAAGLRAHPGAVVVTASCDLPALDGATVGELVRSLDHDPDAAAAVPVVGGVWQSQLVAFRRPGLDRLAEQFLAGRRSLWRSLSVLRVVEVTTLDPDRLRDLDSPQDLADYASRPGIDAERPPT